MADISVIKLPNGSEYNIVDNTSGYATLASPNFIGTPTAPTPAASDNSTKIATTAYVDAAITNLPEPMLFKGSLGTGGTITSLPSATTSNEGFVYKVITNGTYASQAAKVGDTFISDGSNWVLIPSGDEPSGTVTSVGVANATNGGLSVSDSPVTSSGTITLGHSNVLSSAQTTQAVYPIKIDKNGHISDYGSAVNIPIQNIWYGTCDTAATTQEKIVTTTTENFSLIVGNMIRIKFTNGQTYDGTTTINVDGTGAINAVSVGITAAPRFFYRAGEVVDFVYDGTNFTQLEGGHASTQYYGNTKLSSDINSTSESLAATPKAVKTAYDLANGKQDALVSGTNIKTINNESILGSGNISVSGGGSKTFWYGTSPTSSNVQTKDVTTLSGDFTLTTGNALRVKFDNAQTYNGGIKLNVDGTGAIDACVMGTSPTQRYFYRSGEVVDFVFDGVNFTQVDGANASTTYYGNTKLSSAINSQSQNLAATPYAVKQAYDLANSKADPYTAGDGIDITNNIISIELTDDVINIWTEILGGDSL